jgi:hypothetical protein
MNLRSVVNCLPHHLPGENQEAMKDYQKAAIIASREEDEGVTSENTKDVRLRSALASVVVEDGRQ